MALIQCMTISSAMESNRYSSPKGNEYIFYSSRPIEVKDKDDIEFFLSKDHKGIFVEINAAQKVKSAVKDAVETVKDKVNEALGKEKEYTYKDLKKLNKAQQVEIIRSYDPVVKIPSLEDSRINLILKLSGGI